MPLLSVLCHDHLNFAHGPFLAIKANSPMIKDLYADSALLR